MQDLAFLAWIAALAFACALPLWLAKRPAAWVLGLVLYLGLSFPLALVTAGVASFTFIRLLCHTLFLGLPLYLLLTAYFLPRPWRRLNLSVLALILCVGIDAFLVEPRWLTTSYHTLSSPLIKRPLRIVSLADLQTDHVGRYERKALLHARALQPDLVVFDGDYVQVGDPAERARQVGQLNALLREVGLKPRLGAFAVQGDVEWGYDDWPILFAGTGVHALPKTGVLDLGELELAGLTLHDSRVGCVLPLKKKFRVVFGHAPDFALRPPSGDLLLAGHTHGGQIQMPFFGPLITLSQVPRAWAGGGLVDLGAGRHLIVSRGIGRERGPAPQLRFNCRPEIVVIDLIPAEKETGSSSKEPR